MTQTTLHATNEAAILSRAVAPDRGDWPTDIARAVLSIKLSSADLDRMDDLAAKARDDTLSANEELEIESYRQVCRLLECMKAKALASVGRPAPAS